MVTDRTILRPVTVADVDALVGLATDPQVRAFLGGPQSPSDAYTQASARVAAARADDLIVEDRASTSVIGHVDLESQSDRWELSYEFSPGVWGRGLAYEAIRAALERLEQHHPGAHVVAETQTANDRSRMLLSRLGFLPVDRYQRKGAEQLLYSNRVAEVSVVSEVSLDH
ncbi:MAG: GNAT family N-acetyltransferase [Microlunatus sp.]